MFIDVLPITQYLLVKHMTSVLWDISEQQSMFS